MIVIASRNKEKVSEICALESCAGLELKGIDEFGGCPEVEEEGTSFEENAAIKAVKYSLWLRRDHGIWPPVVAEDSGLSVEGLLGWPGVHSARIAESDDERIKAVLERMEGLSSRSARFVAVTALAVNGTLMKTFSGFVQGAIAEQSSGNAGFGYDPIFLEPVSGKTMAQLSSDEKNRVSHRGKAWGKMFDFLREQSAVGRI